MATDNTILNPGVSGDTIRDILKGDAKTQVVIQDYGGAGAEDLTPRASGAGVVTSATPRTVEASDSPLVTAVDGLLTDAQLRATPLDVTVTGGGGPVTIADGADVTQGAVADAAWVSGDGTVISLLKKIASAGGGAVSIADGADVTEGAIADAAVTTNTTGTISGKLRGLVALLSSIISGGVVQATNVDRVATGTITTSSPDNVAIETDGMANILVRMSGSWTGTIEVQGTINGTNWSASNIKTFFLDGSIFSQSGVTSNQTFAVLCGGYASIRLIGPTDTGTATIVLNASARSLVQMAVAPVEGLITNLAKVGGQDVSTVTTGVQKVGIADSDANAFLSAVDALNSTGTGLQASQMVGQFDDSSPQTITEGRFGNVRMSANRNLYGTIRDAAGNERGANVDASNRLTVAVGNTVTVGLPANAAQETGGNLAATAASTAATAASASVLDDWDESDRAKVNLIVGQAGVASGAGTVDATTQRTTLASNDPAVVALQIMDDWDESDRAKVNPIVGQAGVQGASGAVSANTQRVVLATDVALPAGTNAIGKLAANDGVDIGDVTVNNAGGASAVNIQDGGNTITVDGAVSVTGSVTANAGTNLNTSLLALEAGGNLAEIKTNTDNIPPLGQAEMSASTPVVIASDQDPIPITGSISATSAATATESVPEYTEGESEPLSQTLSGQLRILTYGRVSDVPPPAIDGAIQTISLTNEGRLRASVVSARIEVPMFDPDEESMWGNLEAVHEAQPSSPWGAW